MRIGLDIRNLETWARFRGGGCFTANLVKALSLLDRENDYLLFGWKRAEKADAFLSALGDNFRFIPFRVPSLYRRFHWLLDGRFFARHLLAHGVDVFHQPDPFKMFFTGADLPLKTVAMVHDFIPFVFPPPPSVKAGVFRRIAERTCRELRRVTHCCVNSENTKLDLMRNLGVSGERITITYPAHSFDPLPAGEEMKRKVREKYNLSGRFILYVGGLEVRKNIFRLLKAFKKASSGLSEEVCLVMVGWEGRRKGSPDLQEALSLIRELGLNDQVLFPGYVPEEELVAFYSEAELFFFPSLYEGFGMVCLDAMAQGCPVVASKTTALPEVVGDAGLLVNPGDVGEMAGALCRVLTDSSLREELKKKSLLRSRLFSWEETARRTLEVYRFLGRK